MVLVLVLSLALPLSGAPQGAGEWSSLQSLKLGEKIEVELQTGETQTGRFKSVTGSAMTLQIDKRDIDFKREEIGHVYRPGSKHIGTTTAKGAAVGAVAGAAVGAAIGDDGGPLSISRGGMAILGAMFFAIPGAIVGLVVGAVHERERQVIY